MPRKKAAVSEEAKAEEVVEVRKASVKTPKITVEKFHAGVKAYYDYCEQAEGEAPSAAGLAGSLGLTKREMNSLTQPSEDNPDWETYARILEMAQDRREAFLYKRMVTEKGVAQGCLNALKQEENGGYTDRPIDKGTKQLTVNVIGVGGESAFK